MSQRLPFFPAYWGASRRCAKSFEQALLTLAARPGVGYADFNQAALSHLFEELGGAAAATRPGLSQQLATETQLALAWGQFVLNGRRTYELAPALAEELLHTDAGDLRLADIRFPAATFYLHFGSELGLTLPRSDEPAEGVFVLDSGRQGLRMVVVGRLAPTASPSQRAGESFALRFPPECLDDGVDQAVARAIDWDQADLEAARAVLSARYAPGAGTGSVEHLQQRNAAAVAMVTRVLGLCVNALAYQTAYPGDQTMGWSDQAPQSLVAKSECGATPKERERAASKLKALGHDKRTLIGPQFQQAAANVARMPHWRRGHWRNQPHGPQMSLRRLTWIRPTRVLGRSGRDAALKDADAPPEGGPG
jgi:hypothetical protein